jgi:glycosyltransferase involved in cell wall biosynthesis
VLVTNNWGCIEWAMANTLQPLVRQVHIEDGFGPEERARQLPRRVWTRRLVLRRAEIVLPSQTLLTLARDVWKLPRRHLHYVPNGIDLARFAPAPRAPNSVPVIGTVAALRPEKNLLRLIDAFALLRANLPARLEVAGSGAQLTALQDRVAAHGLQADVGFLGHLADPAPAYRRFDIFALSSDTEQMPIALLEAMASGLAVAATDVGDVAAMLPEASRASVVSCDAAVLAAALHTLCADPQLRRRLAAANLAAAAQFDQRRMFDTYRGLFLPE